jgi:CRISPR-associated protein Csb2
MNRAPDLPEATVLGLLNKLTGAPSFVLPPHIEAHTRHYYPDENHRIGLPKNTDKILDPFVVVSPGDQVVVRWNGTMTETERDALCYLAERLSYLGRSESLCTLRLLDDTEHGLPWLSPTRGTEVSDTVRVLVPVSPLDVSGLIERPSLLRRRHLLDPPGSVWEEYPRPAPAVPARRSHRPRPREVAAIRFAISAPALPSRKATVAMTHVLRAAAMARFGGAQRAKRSPTLAGKDESSMRLTLQHRHAHYLALGREGAHLLDTLIVWAPGGLTDEEVAAVTGLRFLRSTGYAPDFRPCRLGLEGYGSAADVAPELVGPSSSWTTYTPFVPTRHSRERYLSDFLRREVSRELAFRGLPPPAMVDVVPGDWLDYRRHRPVGRGTREGGRGYGLNILFAEPVFGPISLGALSHFGLGLFVPIAEA